MSKYGPSIRARVGGGREGGGREESNGEHNITCGICGPGILVVVPASSGR